MRSKAIFMALLAFAFGAQAVPVSREQVRSAARAWVNRGQVFEERLGLAVDKVAEYRTTTGAKFYAVKMSGGGTVFMSADDQVSPVIAFTASDADFTTIDPKSPLWALLNADVSGRGVVLSSSSGSTQAATATALWRKLLTDGASARKSGEALDGASPKMSIGDLRVNKLVKSQWDQTTAYGQNCYNYYTPENYYCGCVATATSQLLRYLYGPSDDGGLGYAAPAVKGGTFDCTVDGSPVKRTVDGKPYDWNKMTLIPATGVSEEQCQAIGKLTSDVGATVNMSYTSDGSGAMSVKVAGSLVNVFGFKQACYVGDIYTTDQFDLTAAKLQRTMFTNFDAGYPVLLSINGDLGGHAIVADGYGYDEGLPYVHLNMGWSGSQDMWYNLPYMERAGFNVVQGVTYNAFPTAGGLSSTSQVKAGVMSGRILDDDGEGIVGASITITDSSTQAAVTNLVSGTKGIWSAILPAGTYDLSAASPDGLAVADEENVELVMPPSKGSDYGPYVPWSSTVVGNSWGNDLVLAPPSVRVGEVTFSSLDKALAAARDGDVVEILLPTALKRSCAIGVNCTIRAADGLQPADVAVNFLKDATLSVAAPARVLFQDVAFTNVAQNVVITVAAGGTAAVKGSVGVQEFDTADADGFELAGKITTSFFLDCKGMKQAKDVIGRVTAGEAELEGCAANIRIRNEYDPDGELGGKVSGSDLIWDSVPVPDDSAVVRLVFGDGTHRNFMTFKTMVGYMTRDVTAIEVCKDCLVSNRLELAEGMRLLLTSSESASRTLFAASTAGFAIPAGAELVVSNLTVSGQNGYNGDVMFDVNGGELVLAKGATLSDLTGASGQYSGAVLVDEGVVTMLSGSQIVRCKSVNGGAIALSGEGCLADLRGGTITGCQASYGGGVYASWYSEVRVSGNVRVTGNTDSAKKANNIYLNDEDAIFTLAGRTSGKIGVQYGYPPDEPGEIGNVADSLFIAVGEGVSAADAAASCASFSCDLDPELMVTVAEDGQSLVWAEKPPYTGEVDPSEAAALVIYNDGQPGATTNFYVNFDWAIESLTNDATVVLCGTNTLSADLTIDRKVLVRSASSVRDEALYRTADAQLNVVSGGSLVLTNVLFSMADDYLERNKGAVCTKSLITVSGGELVLQSGAVIDNCWCTFYGKAGGVTVTDNGRFRMERGAEISFCRNFYTTVKELDVVTVGGVMVCKGSSAEFAGGQVSSCSSLVVGGVYVDGESTVHVSGDSKIAENFDLDAVESNMIAGRGVVLDDVFTGSVRLSENIASVDYPEFSTNVFGSVAAGFTWALSDLAASAANFRRDADPKVRGCAVTNATKALLVWSTAVDGDGVYTDEDGNKYRVVEEPTPPTEIDPPTAVMGLVYNGNEQTGVVEADGYTVTGNVAINAGDYTATVTLRAGYVWTGGSTDPLQIGWSIAKATYDMSGVTFVDAEFVEDGTPKSLAISGDLPDGVSVSYEGNGQSAPGSYTVTAKFAGDAANYEPIDDMTATLTITKKEDPEPDPQWTVVTNQPTPIAFKSIDRVTDTEWTLVITDRVEYCNYRLLWTTNLVEGFVSTGAWEHAVGPAAEPVWTTNVITTGGAWFWRAEGTEGTNMVPRVEE